MLPLWCMILISTLFAFKLNNNEKRIDAIAGNITHILFDFDGTLVDSDNGYINAIDSVTSVYGKHFTRKESELLNITDVRLGASTIIKYFNLPLSEQQFYENVMREFAILRRNVPLMPGVRKLVLHLHKNRIPIGICSATDSKSFREITEHFGDFFKPGVYFEVIVTAKDDPEVLRNKPFPDPYLAAINRFKAKPKPGQVLSFEDSPTGVRSATNAGTNCVLIRNPDIAYDFKTIKPTVVINNLTEFNPEWFALPGF